MSKQQLVIPRLLRGIAPPERAASALRVAAERRRTNARISHVQSPGQENKAALVRCRRSSHGRQNLDFPSARRSPTLDARTRRQTFGARWLWFRQPHHVEAKGFNAHDGTAISLARLAGIKMGLITKRISDTVALRARDLKLEHVHQGIQDKRTVFEEILAQEGLQPEEAAYVGDDVIDLPVMRNCGLAVAVPNAREEVKDEAHFITDHAGGDGALRDAVEYILKAQGSGTR